MPHTTTPATPTARSGRRASAPSAGASRRAPATAIPVMPLWQGLAQLFAPADTAVRP